MRLGALLRALRPKQWTKNLFVFAPLLFSHEFHMEGKVARVAATFGIFCLLSSAVYLMNDIADREADRLHPRKRLRPIAAGELPVPVAVAAACVLAVGAFAWLRFGLASRHVLEVCAGYAAIQVAYTFWLKRVVIVDVLCIASGFVLRLLAGGSAAWVQESAWILVCTIFVSLLLALCKRRHEVVSLGDGAAAHRAILADYPVPFLDQLIGSATACTLVTYALYTVDPRTSRAHRLEPEGVLAVTLPFVIFGVFRYLWLVYRQGGGGSPTTTLLTDAPLLVNGLLYAGCVAYVFSRAA